MSHASTRRRRAARDEPHHGLRRVSVLLQPLRGVLLRRAADLADHHDALRLRIVREALQTVDEVRAVERIAADAHHRRLAQAVLRRLRHRLVRQRARARHHADLALLVDVPGHDADLALARLDDTGAVRTDQTRLRLALHDVLHAEHVVLGNSLGDAHDQRDLRSHSLQNGGSSTAGRHVDDGSVSIRSLLGLER